MASGQREFTRVTIGRSDGTVYSSDDLTRSSRTTVRWSEPLPDDDPRVLRWKFTIGRALAAEMGWPKEKEYIVDFPEHYVLRTKDQKAKQGSDKKREDPFMVGHPAGCADKHCFRSPGEFVYHLIWLFSNSTDRTQCPCKVCVEVTDSGKKKERPIPLPFKTEDATPTPVPQKVTPVPIPIPGGTPTSSPAPTKPSPAMAATKASPVTPSPAPAPAPAPPLRDDTMFRQGEMVWFKATAWRIGIIALPGNNNPSANGSTSARYLLAPLGHSGLAQQNVVKGEEDMRPFLTFSVPQIGIEGLVGKTYGEIDWPTFAKGFTGNKEIVGLEASKMAALTIDGSYSVFNKLQSTDPTKQFYGGIFLGAENIHIGDAVRLKPVSGERFVMEIGKIYIDESGPKFQGNIYRPVTVALAERAKFPPETQPQGPTFQQEMEFRNRVQAVHNIAWVWQLVEQDALRKELDVAGRFYVTPKLMKILDPARFHTTVESHVVDDAMSYLNNRMQSGGIRYIGKRPNRRTTVGQAVSTTLAMGEGISEENY